MLAIAISILFGLAAFAAAFVVYGSIAAGTRRGRLILAELEAGAKPLNRPALRPAAARQRQLVAA